MESPDKSNVTKIPAHSPGPWFVDPDTRPGMEWNNHIYAADNLAVCFMAHSGKSDNSRHEADARLIAAAPTLLDACLAAEKWLEGWASAEPYLTALRAAIKKARVE